MSASNPLYFKRNESVPIAKLDHGLDSCVHNVWLVPINTASTTKNTYKLYHTADLTFNDGKPPQTLNNDDTLQKTHVIGGLV